MTASPGERLRVALAGAEYFAAEAAIDLENGDRDALRSHLENLRTIVISGLAAFNELPAPQWPNDETRKAFGRAAVEWRKSEAA